MDEIVLYSTGCPKCMVLEQKLKEKGIEFNINNNVDEMLEMGMNSVPGLKIGNEVLGFLDAVKWVNER